MHILHLHLEQKNGGKGRPENVSEFADLLYVCIYVSM